MLEIKKTGKDEVRQQHCTIRNIWKTGTDPVRYEQESTKLLQRHRLSSRGAYLLETPSRGRFTTLSDGGRLFLNLFSNERVGRAAQRLGVRAEFWNLQYGERYDVSHPANLRRLLRDIADGGILGCMMSVPSIGWNAARCCHRPLRSSAQPWGIEKSRVSLLPPDLACLDTGNRIMRAVIKLARQCRRHNVPWAIENLTKWRKRTMVLAGLSTPCAVVDTSGAPLPMRNTCNLSVTTLFISARVPTEAKPIRRDWQADLRVYFWGPSSPECREHVMMWACNWPDDTPRCAVSSLRRV